MIIAIVILGMFCGFGLWILLTDGFPKDLRAWIIWTFFGFIFTLVIIQGLLVAAAIL